MTFTTGTGASGEIRDTLPQMNSSSIRSPITRMRLPRNPATRVRSRARSSSGMRGHDLARRAQTLRRRVIRAPGIPSDYDQRQAGPWQKSFDPTPQPHGFIEHFEDRFIDAPGTYDPAVGPPGQSARLVELVDLLDGEPGRFERLARLGHTIAAQMA